MNNQQNNITLEDIALQKEKLRKRIGVQKQKMTTLTQGFIAPLKPTVKKSNAVIGDNDEQKAIPQGRDLKLVD